MSVGKNSISRISGAAKSGTAGTASKSATKTVKPASETPVEVKVEPALSTEITIAAPAKAKTASRKTAPKTATPKAEKPVGTVVAKADGQVEAVEASASPCHLGEDLPVFLL